MEDAKNIAKDQGVSVNQFTATILAERVGQVKALTHVRNRARRGDAKAALAILGRARDVPQMPGDEKIS